MNSVSEKLWANHYAKKEQLEQAEEELKQTRLTLKKRMNEVTVAKSSVYQATKIRNNLMDEIRKSRSKASSYLSQRRSWGKKNMGNIIAEF